MTVLLCGVSLAAYAIIPQVRIIWWSVTSITSRSAHLVVEHEGAVSVKIDVCNSDTVSIKEHFSYPGTISPDDIVYSPYEIDNLKSNTEYIIKVTVRGFPDEMGNSNTDVAYISFTTDSEL